MTSEFGWIANAVGIAIVSLALSWLYVTVRNRFKGDEPRCRACEYELTGLPSGAERCPECGAKIGTAGAVQIGRRRPLARPLVLTGGAIVLAIVLHLAGDAVDARIDAYNRRPGEFAKAVMAGDEAAASAIYQADSSMIRRSSTTPPLIVLAVRADSVPLVRLIMPEQPLTTPVKGEDLVGYTVPRPTSTTLAHLAAAMGANATLGMLLAEGPWDVNVRDSEDRTPLHYAAANGNAATVKALLALPGIDINARDRVGATPLVRAARSRERGVLRILLDAGCRIEGIDEDARTPLHHLVAHDSVLAFELYARGADISAKDSEGKTPLQVFPDWPDSYGFARNVLLHRQSKSGQQGLAEVFRSDPLLREFAARVILGDTNDVAFLRDALQAGVDPNARDMTGTTPLMHWTARGDVEATRLLLDAGAEINAANNDGQTALMVAGMYGGGNLPRLTELLLSRGADASAVDKFGSGVAYYAATRHHDDVSKLKAILKSGLSLDATAAIRLGRLDELSEMLDAKPELINASNNIDGYNLLQVAIAARNRRAFELLLSRGADINHRARTRLVESIGNAGRRPAESRVTSLDIAARFGNREAALVLLMNGIKVEDVATGGFQTPLQNACRSGWTDVARLLIEAGADVNGIGGVQRNRPLDVAVDASEEEVVRLLLSRGADPKLLAPDVLQRLQASSKTDTKSAELMRLLLTATPQRKAD